MLASHFSHVCPVGIGRGEEVGMRGPFEVIRACTHVCVCVCVCVWQTGPWYVSRTSPRRKLTSWSGCVPESTPAGPKVRSCSSLFFSLFICLLFQTHKQPRYDDPPPPTTAQHLGTPSEMSESFAPPQGITPFFLLNRANQSSAGVSDRLSSSLWTLHDSLLVIEVFCFFPNLL